MPLPLLAELERVTESFETRTLIPTEFTWAVMSAVGLKDALMTLNMLLTAFPAASIEVVAMKKIRINKSVFMVL